MTLEYFSIAIDSFIVIVIIFTKQYAYLTLLQFLLLYTGIN